MISKRVSCRNTFFDGLQEGVMQERILRIKLMNRPGVGDDQGEHCVDHDRLDHRAEGLIVVDARSLDEVMNDPMSLIPFQRAIKVELVLENPFASDEVGANKARDKILGIAGDQDSKLFFHHACLTLVVASMVSYPVC
jgi:hypothetical protein